MKRNSLPIGTLFMILVLALALLGVGYGLWSKMLLINGTINTGVVDAIFAIAFTDDDNKLNNPEKDAGDEGGEAGCIVGGGACDPSEYGPNPSRYDKDVGRCFAVVDPEDEEKLTVTVENGYPSYHCTVWFDILNNGTIPVMIQDLAVTGDNFTNGVEVSVALSELACGQQIDPQDLKQGDIHIHVEQSAAQKAVYTFSAELFLVQWNEFDKSQCP